MLNKIKWDQINTMDHTIIRIIIVHWRHLYSCKFNIKYIRNKFHGYIIITNLYIYMKNIIINYGLHFNCSIFTPWCYPFPVWTPIQCINLQINTTNKYYIILNSLQTSSACPGSVNLACFGFLISWIGLITNLSF